MDDTGNFRTFTARIGDRTFTLSPGQSLGSLLQSAVPGVASAAMPCGGHGKCGKCKVRAAGALSPVTAAERHFLTDDELAAGMRLACQTFAEGNVELTLPDAERAARIITDGELPQYALAPGFTAYGAAVDIGTTTVAATLYDARGTRLAQASALNPQRRWGADVISRMEAALAGEATELSAAIRAEICGLLTSLATQAGIGTECIDGAVITGNTVMLHLLAGVNTEPLTHAPFIASELFGRTLRAAELELSPLSPETPIYLPRCIAAFVGADITSALLAAEAYSAGHTELLTDIGTNGEMVLNIDGRLLACSTAAGPAFEGAGISMGMGGSAGAIDRVYLAEDNSESPFQVHVIGDVAPVGICGSGLIDAVAGLLETEAIDETGFMEDAPAMLTPPVCLTQADIRAVQLAKSAVHAGIRTLLKTAGLRPDNIETLYIAGGFGNSLNVDNAGRIGLIPAELTSRVRSVGNAALAGASLMLLSLPKRAESEALAKKVEVVELSNDPVFANEFMEQMMFPV